MKIGFVGLGKMGSNMVLNLLEQGHSVVVYDTVAERVAELVDAGATGASSLRTIGEMLEPPRVVWLMVPAGPIVDLVIDEVAAELGEGDILIDGGNSFYKDSIRRAEELIKRVGISYLDVGTSGGLQGARLGASMTIGGDRAVIERLLPLFEVMATPNGFAYVGQSGAGHFTKMVHNGIEYAMLEAYGEGVELLSSAPFDIDIVSAVSAWQNGGVIRSWLLELAGRALEKDPSLENAPASVGGGETGEWTVQASIEQKTAVPVIYSALAARYRSRQVNTVAGRLISALRREFGGHT